MWIIKILFVISVVTSRAEVNGLLQNEFNDGYSYDRPQPVPAELAFYLNIPAGHDPTPYIAKTEGHFNQHQHFSQGKAPNFAGNYGHAFSYSNQHQIHEAVPQSLAENHGFSLNSIHHQFNEPQKQYIPPTQTHNLPFIQQNSGFRPINPPHQQQNLPFIQENSGLRPLNQAYQQQNAGFSYQQQHSNGPLQQYFQYRVQPRHQVSQNTIKFHHQEKIAPHFQPQTQNSAFPSQELKPPPSFKTVSPSTISTNEPTPNRGLSASDSSSYNAPLPFAFGVVPLKFDPLPLKTHLRQEKLLPISSYEAKVFHRLS